jgi:hypothetical protein
VLRRIGLYLTPYQIEAAVTCQPEAIERILAVLQNKIEVYEQGPQLHQEQHQ